MVPVRSSTFLFLVGRGICFSRRFSPLPSGVLRVPLFRGIVCAYFISLIPISSNPYLEPPNFLYIMGDVWGAGGTKIFSLAARVVAFLRSWSDELLAADVTVTFRCVKRLSYMESRRYELQL